MGLLDDIRNKVEGQRVAEQETAARSGEREQIYREQILPRMVKAYQFFKELTEHLNYIKMDTMVEYPLYANGGTQPMRQEGYAVLIDSSKELKQIDITFQCVLDNPISFEVYNKDISINHSEHLDRYFIKYERKDKKNATLEVVASKFTIIGPLQLKVGITANIANSDIRIALRNFTEPGTNTYTLKLEEFDDAFLDRLGKYILRQQQTLIGGKTTNIEMSEDAKAQLRERLVREQKQREQELKEAEERERQEAELRKQKSAKEQLKKAVNTQLEQQKEKLKGMFGKLKDQASSVLSAAHKQSVDTPAAPQQPPASPVQTSHQQPLKPPSPAQTPPHVTATPNTAERVKTPAAAMPPMNAQKSPPMRIPSVAQTPTAKTDQAPKKVQTPQPVQMSKPAPTPASRVVVPAENKVQSKPVATTPVATPQNAVPPVIQSPVKKAQPPKIYNASPDNPFIKPEPPEEVEKPAATEVAEQATPQHEKSPTPISAVNEPAPRPDLTPDALEQDLARILERDNLKDIRVDPNAKSPAPVQKPAVQQAMTQAKVEAAPMPKPQAPTDKPKPEHKLDIQPATVQVKVETALMPESEAPADKSRPILKPGELNTGLVMAPAVESVTQAEQPAMPESKASPESQAIPQQTAEQPDEPKTTDTADIKAKPQQKIELTLEPLDIDVAENTEAVDEDKPKENS